MIDTAAVAREARVLAGIYKAVLSTDPGTFSNAFVYDALEWCSSFVDSLCTPLLRLGDPHTEEKVDAILREAATEQGCADYVASSFLSVSELSRRGRQNLLLLLLTNPFVPDHVHAQAVSYLIAPDKGLDAGCANVLAAGREACVWMNKDPQKAEDTIVSRVSKLIVSFDNGQQQALLAALASKCLNSPICLKISLTVIKSADGKHARPGLSQRFIDAVCGDDFLPDALLDLPLFSETLSVDSFHDSVKKTFFDKISDVFRRIVAGGCVLPEEGSSESKLVYRLGKCYKKLCAKDSDGSLRAQVERLSLVFKSKPSLYKYFEKSILLNG